MRRLLWGLLLMTLPASAEPAPTATPAPTPDPRHIAAGSLLERVNAPGAVVAPAGPTVETRPLGSTLEQPSLRFHFFYFGPALGASFRL